MEIRISTVDIVEQTYSNVASEREAIELFLEDRGYAGIEDAADAVGLSADEYRASLVVEQAETGDGQRRLDANNCD